MDLLWCRSLQPFRARWDNRLWAAGLATVLLTIYIGQQMSDAQNGLPLGLSETGANVLLIAVNISLVLLAVVFTAWQFAEETRTGDGGAAHQRTVVVPVDSRREDQEEKDTRVDAEQDLQGAVEATADNETGARASTAGAQRRIARGVSTTPSGGRGVQGMKDAQEGQPLTAMDGLDSLPVIARKDGINRAG